MSGAVMQPGFGGPDAARVSHKWGWFVALGVVMVLGGIFALGDTVLVTIISVIFIGVAMLVGGIFQIIHAFMTKGWSAFAFSLICGILYVVGGLLIMDEPVAGSVVITIFLAVALAVGGVEPVAAWDDHRDRADFSGRRVDRTGLLIAQAEGSVGRTRARSDQGVTGSVRTASAVARCNRVPVAGGCGRRRGGAAPPGFHGYGPPPFSPAPEHRRSRRNPMSPP